MHQILIQVHASSFTTTYILKDLRTGPIYGLSTGLINNTLQYTAEPNSIKHLVDIK